MSNPTVDPEAALMVANFARGVSSELNSVKQKITSGQQHLAPVVLDKQGLIAGLTGAAVPQDIAQQAIPDNIDLSTLNVVPQDMGKQQRPMLPYTNTVQTQLPSQHSESMLNMIMLSLVSIEKQLGLLHKALKQPSKPRKTKE